MAGHHTGAMLLEDTHPEDVEWMPTLVPGVPGTTLSAAAGLWQGLQRPSCQRIPLSTSYRGGCGSDGLCKGECRSVSGCSGHLMPAARQCPQMRLSVPPHPTAQAADAVPAGDVLGVMPDSFHPCPGPGEFVHSAAQRWMSAASAAAPLPMPGRLIPAQASFHPLLGSDYSPWGGMDGVWTGSWVHCTCVGGRKLLSICLPADFSQHLPAAPFGCSLE